jgi:hypothetical protein
VQVPHTVNPVPTRDLAAWFASSSNQVDNKDSSVQVDPAGIVPFLALFMQHSGKASKIAIGGWLRLMYYFRPTDQHRN